MALEFDTHFDPSYGQAIPVAPDVQRVTVENPSPFTFHGTNSYVVGRDAVCVIDPGPEDERHFLALLRAIDGRPVTHVLVSHTHRDHSPLARRLAETTGALTAGEGPHRSSRALRVGETNALDASADMEFTPDIMLADGDRIEVGQMIIEAVLTPGHTANHTAFALTGTGILFSADHVMAWSTSVVAPPDGAMSDYMASLDKLLDRDDTFYLPGHGGPLAKPAPFLRGLKAHRRMRERAILERLRAGDRTIPELVAVIYRDTDPRLHGAAGLSVLAHLEGLVEAGAVAAEGEISISSAYRPV